MYELHSARETYKSDTLSEDVQVTWVRYEGHISCETDMTL